MAVSVLSWSTIRIHLFGTGLFNDEYVVDPYVVELCSKNEVLLRGAHVWTTFGQSPMCYKVLQRGAYVWTTFGQSPQWDKVLWWGVDFGLHLVKVRCKTKSSNKLYNLGHIWSKPTAWQSPLTRGTYLDHIWPKSAVRQSPLTRGTFRTTFGQSLLRDKVLQSGAQFGPDLVKVRSETKSSNEGHHFLCHIWLLSTARQLRLITFGIILWPPLTKVSCMTRPQVN